MAKVEFGVNLRKAYPWLEEVAADEIKAMEQEIRDCFQEPKVDLKEVSVIGKMYRKKASEVSAALMELAELRYTMLNFWCQHGVTLFSLPDFDPYQLIPRKELSLQDEALEGLLVAKLGEEKAKRAFLRMSKKVRVWDPALILAYFSLDSCPIPKEEIGGIIDADCTPEIRPPKETPKEKDKRLSIGKSRPREKKPSTKKK